MFSKIGLAIVWAAFSICAASAAESEPLPTRTSLATVPITPGKVVSRVEQTRVDFAPGQIMPKHKHTVPVICFVSRGEFLVKIGDAPERRVGVGGVTFEPPQVVVEYFRNSSDREPAQLVCSSLAGDEDKTLNVMLTSP